MTEDREDLSMTADTEPAIQGIGGSNTEGPEGAPASLTRAWRRVLAMLRLEPGISVEIASDPNSTMQGLIVFALAFAIASILYWPLALITLPGTVTSLAIKAGLFCLFSRLFTGEVPLTRLFADEVRPYPQWLRVMFFASAPMALGVIPFIGAIVPSIYSAVLQVVAIRDLARIGPGAAVVVWFIGTILPSLLLSAVYLALGEATFHDDILPRLIGSFMH